MKKSISPFIVAILLSPMLSIAQNGALDPTFGSNSTGCFNPVGESITAHVILADNSIVCTAYDKNAFTNLYQGYVYKFTPDGFFDTTFGPDASGTVPISGNDNLFLSTLALSSDGSIFTCSFDPINSTGGRIDKLSPSGLPVTSFGVNGILELPDFAPDSLIIGLSLVEVDNQDRLLVAININLTATNTGTTCLARLLPDGALDVSFGNGGFYFLPFSNCKIAQILQISDGIILAGSVVTGSGTSAIFSTYCLKLSLAGQPVTSFGNNGVVELSPGIYKRCTAASLMPDGRIALLYFFPVGQLSNSAITMLNPDGSVNSGYATNGTFTLNLGASILAVAEDMDVLPDGSILAVGSTIYSTNTAPGRNALLFKLNPSGNLDSGFGVGGIINEDYTGGDDSYVNIAFQSDYKIILTGTWAFVDFVQAPSESLTSSICRRNNDFSDPTATKNLNLSEISVYPNPLPTSSRVLNVKGISSNTEMRVIGCDGRLLDTYNLSSSQTSVELKSPLLPGIYFLTLTSEGKSLTQKLIIH